MAAAAHSTVAARALGLHASRMDHVPDEPRQDLLGDAWRMHGVVVTDDRVPGASPKSLAPQLVVSEVETAATNGTSASVASSTASTPTAMSVSIGASVPDEGTSGVKRPRGRPPKKPHHLSIKAAAAMAATEEFKMKGMKKAPAYVSSWQTLCRTALTFVYRIHRIAE